MLNKWFLKKTIAILQFSIRQQSKINNGNRKFIYTVSITTDPWDIRIAVKQIVFGKWKAFFCTKLISSGSHSVTLEAT